MAVRLFWHQYGLAGFGSRDANERERLRLKVLELNQISAQWIQIIVFIELEKKKRNCFSIHFFVTVYIINRISRKKKM